MIAANELRIGNWVSEEVIGNVPITRIDKNSVWVGIKHMDLERVITDQEYHLTLINIQPIPLTPEILEKAGFEKKKYIWRDANESNDLYWLERYNIGFNEYKGEKHFFLGRVDNERNPCWLANIKHVHQLQNLYFALTGTELEINLNP